MPGEMITFSGQIEWNGLVLGDGTDLNVTSLAGWHDLPPVDLGNSPRAGGHGAQAGIPQADQRTVTCEFSILPVPPISTQQLRDAVRAATPIARTGEQVIVVRDFGAGSELMAWGQVQNRALPMPKGYQLRIPGCALQWVCSDPRRYSLTEQSITIGAPSPGTGGLPFPLEYPLDWGTPGVPGLGVAVNNGDADTFPRVVFTGPVEGPYLQNFLTGARIAFDVDLTAGQQLVVDCRTETALVGTATVMPLIGDLSVPLQDFVFEPGEENPLIFSGGAFDGDEASAVVSWRSAWW